MSRFSFSGLTLTTAVPSLDVLRIAREWTEADPDHRETTKPDFWFENRMGVESYVLTDAKGIIFFFKMSREVKGCVELHIQFPPPFDNPRQEADRRERVMQGLTLGLQWIEVVLAHRGVTKLCFTSRSPHLIRFCERKLGFVIDRPLNGHGARLVKELGSDKAAAAGAGN